MNLVLFDTPQTHTAFYPLTLTKPMAQLRQGIFTIQERWQHLTQLPVYAIGEYYLHLPSVPEDESYLYIDAALLFQSYQLQKLLQLETGEGWMQQERVVAVKTSQQLAYPIGANLPDGIRWQPVENESFLQAPWQLFQTNTQAIAADYQLLTASRTTQPIDPTTVVTGGKDIFIEEGVVLKGCFINASEGPVYIGKNALVMEGTTIRGPVAICQGAVIKMGVKLYGGTTIGPHCTAGGEIKNAILSSYSNKAHDGYLGDAVVGEWCNLGAGTTNSNVKNTGGEVKMWNEAIHDFVLIGKKAGLLMGDYSRSAINTGFNTGTVVGICCNVFGNYQPSKHVPSFTWGEERYRFEKALADIANWKQFKGQQLEESEKQMLNELYRSTLPANEI